MPEPVVTRESLSARLLSNPFHRWLGLELLRADGDGVEILLPWRAEIVGNAERRTLHGGILACLVDTAADYAVAARLGRPFPTVDLRVPASCRCRRARRPWRQ